MSDAYQTGYVAGRVTAQVVFGVSLLAGIWKCWHISRRPTTHARCVFALMSVFLGMLVSWVNLTITGFFAHSFGLSIFAGLAAVATMGLYVGAIVLGIAGLADYARKREAYQQGRAQAIWALVLGSVFMLFVFAGFVRSFRSNAALSSAPGRLLTFDDMNFRFRAPGSPWISYDATKFAVNSQVAFMRRFPEAYFSIIAEKLTIPTVTTEQLADVCKDNMRAAAPSARVISQTPERVNGLNGLLIESEAPVNGVPLSYRQWCCVTNNYAYQLVGYSRTEDHARVAGELRELLSGFELIDPHRLAPRLGGLTTNFVSARHHYSVMVQNSPWRASAAMEKSFPRAEFSVTEGDSCFVVVPVRLNGERPGVESLVSAFLSLLEIKYPNEDLTNPKSLVAGELSGEQFDFSRAVDGRTYYYRFKIMQGHDEAWFLAAWTQRRAADAESIFNDAFGRFRFGAFSNGVAPPQEQPTATERSNGAYILNQAGLYYSKRNENEKALPLFVAAARADTESSIYAGNALYSWRNLDRPKEALAFLEGRPPSVLALPAIRADQALFQEQASLVEEAITNYAAVFASGFRDENHFTEYIGLLSEQKRYDDALAAVQDYLKAGDSTSARLLEAGVYSLKQEVPEAIKILTELHDKAPFNTQVSTRLVESYILAARYSDALELSKKVEADNPDSAFASYWRGRSELGLKWYREAQASFANALRLSPANRDIRSYRDFVNGLMGQGDNSAVVDPIEPVAFPAALTNTPDEPATAGYAKKYGAYYARRITATRYLPGKEHKTTDLILVNILDSSGVSAFSTVQFGFDPLAEQVYVNEVRVMDAGGKTLSAGSPTNYYVLDDRTSTSASQKKVLNVPVPGLQPGCRLAVTFTRRDQGRIEDFPFQSYCFSRYSPVRESIFFLAGDAHGLKYRSSVEPEKLPEGLVWRVSDPALAVWEPLQPTAATFLPMLWISDASAQWPALVTNYLASIRDRLEPDAALQEQSRKLVAGMTDDDAKIAALASYVQTNLTYKALEFGRRARIPNKPAEVIQNKYGDCKDHSVLLQQMLAAAGVPAQLALAGHRGPIQQDLPSLDQFDHMIVFVPGAAGGRFLDCTGKGTDVAHALPLELEGQDVLVLDAANPRFVTIPAYPTNASSISAEQHVQVVDLTDMAVEESLIFSGVYAAYLRGYLLQIPEASRRTTLQGELAMTDADLTDVKMEALDNPREPLRLAFTYSIKRQFRRSNGELRGVLHAGYCRNYLQAAPVETRLTPFEITVPYTLESKIAVAIPAGYQAVRPDNLNPVFDARFATCEGRARIDGNQLLVDFKYRPTIGKFKAGDYSAYRETMAQAMSLLEREVVFKANTP